MSDYFSVLFVGGTGAISGSCVAEAVSQGLAVSVLNRGRSSRLRPLPAGVEVLTGDITDPASVRAALGGAFIIACQDGPSLRLTPTAPDAPDSLAIDPQGRVRLRSFYRRWAGLEPRDRVVLVALGDCLEFWRKETWTWFIKKNGQFEFDLDPHIPRTDRRKD